MMTMMRMKNRLPARASARVAVTALLLLTLAGCGGGGGGSATPPPPGTPTYTLGGTVSGLTGAGLVLRNNGDNDLVIAASGGFTFATPLASGAAYGVSVHAQPAGQSCTVSNDAGTVGGANITNVAVVCRGWGAAGLIETDNAGNAYSPQIAIDAVGNALAVWQQLDGTRYSYNLWANRYTAGAGWDAAGLIETDNAGDVWFPQIAFDANGNALAVWEQYDGTHFNLWANRYTAGAGWGVPVLIETDNAGGAYSPQIAIDAAGNALAVWTQRDGTRSNLWANRYTAGAGWGAAEPIETDNAGNAFSPQIAIDAAGNALAVWYQHDGTRFNLWANRYTAGAGWGAAGPIETDNAGDVYSPQIAIDAIGNALAVWMQSDGTRFNIWVNRYTAGAGWGVAGLIETDNAGGASSPQIAFDARGNALAVWSQSDGTRQNVWANRYTAGAGWGVAGLIETDNAGDASSPQIAFDANGNALAVWMQHDGTRSNIWANRYQ